MMHSGEEVIGTLEELTVLGVKVTVDDFGVGYSSLNYLKRFPVARLKIDRSFVQSLGAAADDTDIAQAIIVLGHSPHMRVVAEGVESSGQVSLLQYSGCDEAQGFAISSDQSACTASVASCPPVDGAVRPAGDAGRLRLFPRKLPFRSSVEREKARFSNAGWPNPAESLPSLLTCGPASRPQQ
jgi:EAL domain-containing protein (putative c-di-GMP-specific phosphodiesterase class I)